jgi:DNA replication protein DnaD
MTVQQAKTWRGEYRAKNREKLNKTAREYYKANRNIRLASMAKYREKRGKLIKEATSPPDRSCPIFKSFQTA